MKKVLYGALANDTKVVGLCYLKRVSLTAHQLKQKQCLQKQCRFLKRYEEKQFWLQRARKKELKKCLKQKSKTTPANYPTEDPSNPSSKP